MSPECTCWHDISATGQARCEGRQAADMRAAVIFVRCRQPALDLLAARSTTFCFAGPAFANRAHVSMSCARLTNRSPRAYAASAL